MVSAATTDDSTRFAATERSIAPAPSSIAMPRASSRVTVPASSIASRFCNDQKTCLGERIVNTMMSAMSSSSTHDPLEPSQRRIAGVFATARVSARSSADPR